MKKKRILPGQTIGILGGGQLGRMMAIAAKEMGYRIAVLDPTPDSPCGQVADTEITASYDDQNAVMELAKISDVLTYEFENIDIKTVEWLEQHAYLPQGSQLLRVTQNRNDEKKAIHDAGIATVAYKIVASIEDLNEGIKELGFPVVLKTTSGGYDGKGQAVIRGQHDIKEAVRLLERGDKCILEEWLNFEKELSVIVTRSVTGETKTFPVAENIHKNNILHQSIVPARIDSDVEEKARAIALQLADYLNLVGTLAVELFLTADGTLYVNELAPRPHNSGHYTIDACETSQFQQHIRAICGWPLGTTNLLKPVVMVNILGQHFEKTLKNLHLLTDGKLHLYGKKKATFNRKIGHLNVLADSTASAMEKINRFSIWDNN